jgi:hypothetical protein
MPLLLMTTVVLVTRTEPYRVLALVVDEDVDIPGQRLEKQEQARGVF